MHGINNNLASYEEKYIDIDGTAGFCSDRNTASGDNYTDSSFHYAAYDRDNGQAKFTMQIVKIYYPTR